MKMNPMKSNVVDSLDFSFCKTVKTPANKQKWKMPNMINSEYVESV